MKDQISGPENAGPSRNAASLGSEIQRAARTPRLRPPGPPSPSPPLQTLLIAVKSACFYSVKVWLCCYADILASVAVAQTLSHPWTVVARYAAHPFAWCVCTAKCRALFITQEKNSFVPSVVHIPTMIGNTWLNGLCNEVYILSTEC